MLKNDRAWEVQVKPPCVCKVCACVSAGGGGIRFRCGDADHCSTRRVGRYIRIRSVQGSPCVQSYSSGFFFYVPEFFVCMYAPVVRALCSTRANDPSRRRKYGAGIGFAEGYCYYCRKAVRG